jgi:hypothetical protein
MRSAPKGWRGWGQTSPFEPQQWDAPDAAERGRERYALEQAKNNKA